MGQESGESVSSCGAEPDLSLLQEEREEEEKEELVGREKHFYVGLYTGNYFKQNFRGILCF